ALRTSDGKTFSTLVLPKIAGFCASYSAMRSNRAGLALTAALLLLLGTAASSAAAECMGDCDASHQGRIDGLSWAVNIALGLADAAECAVYGGSVHIDQLIIAVNNSLDGCPLSADPTDTPISPSTTVATTPTDTPTLVVTPDTPTRTASPTRT